MDISLRKINKNFARELSSILSRDVLLHKTLSSGGTIQKVIPLEFSKKTEKWTKETNSQTFAIVLEDRAIGTISISHIDLANHEAGIGYWIASDFWSQGYGSKAVELAIKKARNLGLNFLNAKVSSNNVASIKIWHKLGAKSRRIKNRIIFKLEI